MKRCLVAKKGLAKTRTSKRLQGLQAFSGTPVSIREPNEACLARGDQLSAGLLSRSKSPHVLPINAPELNSAQTASEATGRPLLDQCMLYQNTTNNPRTSKRKRAIASMEISETSEQGKTRNPKLKKSQTKTTKTAADLSQKQVVKQPTTKKTKSPAAMVGLKLPAAPLKLKAPRSLREIDIEEDTQILINKNTIVDQRTYNAPTTDEVAVIWPDDTSSSESSSPYIVVRGKSNDPHRIYHHYGCYDPLQYPLLFPYGDCGWSQGITKKSGASQEQGNSAMASAIHTEEHVLEQTAIHTEEDVLEQEATRLADASGTSARHISPREYYAYKLQSRPNNMLLRAGDLRLN